MRVATAALVRHTVDRGEYDERDMEDLLEDLQAQLEGPNDLDLHRIDRRWPLRANEEDV